MNRFLTFLLEINMLLACPLPFSIISGSAFIVLLLKLQNFMSVPVEEVIPNLFLSGIDFHYLHGNIPLSYVKTRGPAVHMACPNKKNDCTTRKAVQNQCWGRGSDPHDFGPPESKSISQGNGSGSGCFFFLIKVLSGLK